MIFMIFYLKWVVKYLYIFRFQVKDKGIMPEGKFVLKVQPRDTNK